MGKKFSANKLLKRVFGKHWAMDLLYEVAGSFLAAIAVYNFAVNAKFPMTGFTGLSMILYRLFGFQIGITQILLNIPVAVLCYKLIGRQFFARSIFCMVLSSLFIDYLAPLLPVYEGERFLSALCTGVVGGIGYALIYARNSSTGGSDFIVMAIKAKNQHLKLGTILFACDFIVVAIGGILFKDFDGVIYGLLINYMFAMIADRVLYGMNAGKLALIITDFGDLVSKKIDETCARGTTLISAEGGYKRDHRDIVLCACATKEMVIIEEAVKEVDPKAFTVILESNEVLGEGFNVVNVAKSEKEE
ncbi:MAG: YitT family protein [Lachnospiraceae bacterium]|nr:YitT family protein [Lachnospiraceae bacterium]